MPFKKTPQTFSAAIKAVEIGTGDKAITIGGENVLPLYSFDAEIANAPKIGVEILDTGFENAPAGLKAFYEGCTSMADMAKKAATIEGASFICLHFEGADPNGADRSVDECVADAKAVAEAVDLPIVIMGCKNNEEGFQPVQQVLRSTAGQEHPGSGSKGRDLQGRRRIRWSGLWSEGWR